MFDQKLLHRLVKFELVLVVRKSVTFVVLDHVLNFDAALLQCADDLIALVLVHTRVARALGNE